MLGSQRFGETHFMLIVYLIRNSNCLEGLINSWKSNGAGCVPPCHAVCVCRWNIHTVTRRRWQLRLRRDMIRFGVGSLGATSPAVTLTRDVRREKTWATRQRGFAQSSETEPRAGRWFESFLRVLKHKMRLISFMDVGATFRYVQFCIGVIFLELVLPCILVRDIYVHGTNFPTVSYRLSISVFYFLDRCFLQYLTQSIKVKSSQSEVEFYLIQKSWKIFF